MYEYVIKIPIGDWSDDGHGKCEIIVIKSNYPAKDLQEAYKASCRLTGVQFNNNQDYTGRIVKGENKFNVYSDYRERLICVDYDDSSPSSLAANILKEFGIDCEEFEYFDADNFAKLILQFIQLSMPNDWEYNIYNQEGEYLNGFWNDNLNVQFGYGLFE